MSGIFLTFEGLDGSGKSTHLERSVAWLQQRGVPLLRSREPGGTPLGDAIRQIFLLERRFSNMDSRVEALLVFASRRQHLVEVIEPALAQGIHVLCDRFTDSTLAFQGGGRGLGREWVAGLDGLATGGRRPDRTFLFDLPGEMAMERGQRHHRKGGAGPDRIDGEGIEFYDKVRRAYLDLAEAEPQRFRVIDSSGSSDATWQAVQGHLRELFGDLP
jgi:dTMP kinase